VLGIFADYDVSNIATDFSAFGPSPPPSITRIRIGHGRLSPDEPPYKIGTAGYTQARFDLGTNVGLIDAQDFNGYSSPVSRAGSAAAGRCAPNTASRNRERPCCRCLVLPIDLIRMHTARLALTYKIGRREEVAAL
jgi:hypothetical protein